jgi:hypothetical protein
MTLRVLRRRYGRTLPVYNSMVHIRTYVWTRAIANVQIFSLPNRVLLEMVLEDMAHQKTKLARDGAGGTNHRRMVVVVVSKLDWTSLEAEQERTRQM